MSFRHALVWCLAFIFITTSTSVLAQEWYSENFDGFKVEEIDGQEEWIFEPIAGADRVSPEISKDVFRGNSGKSLKVISNSMCSKKFPDQGKHGGVQYVSYFARVEELGADAVLQNYIGGNNVKWQAAVVFNMTASLKISAFDGKKGGMQETPVSYTLKEWYHVRIVINFDNEIYNVYLNDELAAEDFTFRGAGQNPSLDWITFGLNHPRVITVYIDDLEVGEGEGEHTEAGASVEKSSKLPITWSRLKINY